jgi:AraC-like DNA-binding protein
MANDWLQRISPQIHHGGHLAFKRGVINPLRTIYDHELFMFSSGESTLVFGAEQFSCPKNSFIILPPGREHISYALSAEIHIHWTHFDWTYRAQRGSTPTMSFASQETAPRHIRRAPGFVPDGILHGRVRSMRAFDLHIRLCEEWSSGDSRRRTVARALFLEVLLELLAPEGKAVGGAEHSMTLAEKTRNHLTALANQRFCDAKPIKVSLRELGTSYYHQERVFRKEYGISPSEYVNALRVERIKTLLRETELPVARVAREVGFDDAAYFSRFFSARAGCSPREFRKQQL